MADVHANIYAYTHILQKGELLSCTEWANEHRHRTVDATKNECEKENRTVCVCVTYDCGFISFQETVRERESERKE